MSFCLYAKHFRVIIVSFNDLLMEDFQSKLINFTEILMSEVRRSQKLQENGELWFKLLYLK